MTASHISSPPLIVPDANPAPPLRPLGYGWFWRRVLAGLIDLAVIGILILGMWGLANLVTTIEYPNGNYYYVDDQTFRLFFWGIALVSLGYPILCFSRLGGGGSIGYRVMHLRLISEKTGGPPGIFRTLGWWLGYPPTLAFGWLLYFSEEKRRMLNNMMTGTVVVHVGRTPAPNPLGVTPGSARPAATAPIKCKVCLGSIEPPQNFCRACGTPTPFRSTTSSPFSAAPAK